MTRFSRGFTLIEMLIALNLFGIILVILYSGLRTGVRAWDATRDHTADLSRLRVMSGFVYKQLSQSQALKWADKARQQQFFKGSPQRVEFVAPLPANRETGGLYRQRFEIVPTAGADQSLYFSYQLRHPDLAIDDTETTHSRSLVSRIRQASFSFFGVQNEQHARWHSHWNTPQSLPELVKLQVDNPVMPWPLLIVPIRSRWTADWDLSDIPLPSTGL